MDSAELEAYCNKNLIFYDKSKKHGYDNNCVRFENKFLSKCVGQIVITPRIISAIFYICSILLSCENFVLLSERGFLLAVFFCYRLRLSYCSFIYSLALFS